MSAMQWFRVYNEILDDRKIKLICKQQNVTKAEVIGCWIILLALANAAGKDGNLIRVDNEPYTIDDLSEETGIEVSRLQLILDGFKLMNMIGKKTMSIMNWGKRQFRSDSSLERVRVYRETRKSTGLSISGDYDAAEIYNRDDNACVYCGDTNNLCVDHIVPIRLGGTDDYDNLACACKKCNSGKSGRTPEQAGYKFINQEAEKRYSLYKINRVTVTVTPSESESESESSEADTETKTESKEMNDDEREFFNEYQNNVAFPTGIVIDKLHDDFKEFGKDWCIEAARITNKNAANKNYNYFHACLVNRKNGYDPGKHGKNGKHTVDRTSDKGRKEYARWEN